VYYCKRPKTLKETAESDSAGSGAASAFLLTFANPTTVLSFLAVLAILGLGEHRPWTLTLFLVAGIFAGAMLWWVFLAMVAAHFRQRFNDRGVVWMNRIAAGAIGAFGLITIGMAFK
jgi:threonine/homoserine/homoserine lactone efflux protein